MKLFSLATSFAILLFSFGFTKPIHVGAIDFTIFKTPQLCDIVPGDQKKACDDCITNSDSKKAWTALGCIDAESPAYFTVTLINFSVGIGGGIAFLMTLIGGYQILTSAGNPERLEAGKEVITSSLAGLFMIIFAVFLLRLIGVDILTLPGWVVNPGS